MDVKQQILEAVAANLRAFGYPEATAENVTRALNYAMFAETSVARHRYDHAHQPDVAAACDAILAEIKALVEGV